MFTGLVEALCPLESVLDAPPGKRLVVRLGEEAGQTEIGDSIAINGCCLTVVEKGPETVAFEAGPETLERTNLATLRDGCQVNIERSLKMGDELGGHFVTGHVDATGHLDDRIDSGDWSTYWFRMPARLSKQMVSKGSIAVDGVSLTLVKVERERFSVALIPHTLAVTTLGQLQIGGVVNLETDLLAKYVERQLAGTGARAD